MNKKIEDKGWAAMQELLDRELPVEEPKRKRRGLWFFWLLFAFGMGLISLVFGSGYFFEVEESKQEVQMEYNKPIADASLETTAKKSVENSEEILTNEGENERLMKEIATKKASITNFSKAQTNSQSKIILEKEPEHKGQSGISTSTITQQINTSNSKEIEGNLNDSRTDKANDPIIGLEHKNSSNSSNKYLQASNFSIDFVDKRNLHALTWEETVLPVSFDLTHLSQKGKEDKNKVKGRFGLESHLGGAADFALAGLGVVYDVPLTEKISYQAGINYSYQRRIFSTAFASAALPEGVEIDPLNVDLGDDILFGAYESADANRFDQSAFTVPRRLSFHYLNIRNGITWRFAKKWSLNADVIASLLVYARNDYTDGGIFSDDDLSLQQNETAINTFSGINKASLRDFDVASQLGVGFHPSDKWAIRASYHHGMVNFFKYSSEKKYNRYGAVSVQYFFGK